jgi:phosphatidylserine/phosphatidylglycerophosphate/cardiolipin synthase-like enzyme
METIIGKEFPEKVIPLIESAKTSIDIVIFDWRWYPNDPGASVQLFNQAIVRAVRRGVLVRAVCNYYFLTTILKKVGVVARKINTKNLMHSKLIIFDKKTVVIGSHNYTQNAFQMNCEASVILDDEKCVAGFFSFFNDLWQSST